MGIFQPDKSHFKNVSLQPSGFARQFAGYTKKEISGNLKPPNLSKSVPEMRRKGMLKNRLLSKMRAGGAICGYQKKCLLLQRNFTTGYLMEVPH